MEETRDLLIQLCTKAGMMMEDVSPVAILIPRDDEDASLAIAGIIKNVTTISRLMPTADSLATAGDGGSNFG
jgi:hypothetical protein